MFICSLAYVCVHLCNCVSFVSGPVGLFNNRFVSPRALSDFSTNVFRLGNPRTSQQMLLFASGTLVLLINWLFPPQEPSDLSKMFSPTSGPLGLLKHCFCLFRLGSPRTYQQIVCFASGTLGLLNKCLFPPRDPSDFSNIAGFALGTLGLLNNCFSFASVPLGLFNNQFVSPR